MGRDEHPAAMERAELLRRAHFCVGLAATATDPDVKADISSKWEVERLPQRQHDTSRVRGCHFNDLH
jgi:hypothetical protein